MPTILWLRKLDQPNELNNLNEPNELNKLNKPSKLNKRILIVPPLSYLDFLKLEMYARFVMTDSGGIQEETTVLGVPCLTLRDTTERPVTVTQGTNVVVGGNSNETIQTASETLTAELQCPPDIELWDGKAADRIVDVLASKRLLERT